MKTWTCPDGQMDSRKAFGKLANVTLYLYVLV
jgi:hypothetical protein